MAYDMDRPPLAAIAGALVIILFCIFTLASAARYAGPFSPMDNWLSDLGTPLKNPSGDVYFNVGCIATGVAMLLLVAGIGVWRPGSPGKGVLLTLGQVCGIVAAFALMMVGVFHEDTAYHGIMALAFFLFMWLFLILANMSLWKHPSYVRAFGYYAVLVAVIDVVFIYTFIAYEHAPVWEWIAVFSALLWVAMLAYNTLRLKPA
jgi:hypothetical membrane protein